MCCDGTLFHSVALQTNDSPRTLSSLGLILKRKKGVTTFRQPCSAHQNNQCMIYESRPHRCQLFQCRQIRRVTSGEVSETQSRHVIQTTRQKIQEIKEMIEQITETNASQGLAQRCAVAIANSPSTLHTTELSTAMAALQEVLEKEFRVREEIA